MAREERAVEFELGLVWDTGAPRPTLHRRAGELVLTFRLADGQPPTGVGRVEFFGVCAEKFGEPNDERLPEHALYGRGLHYYGAHEVVHSRWVATERASSREKLRHFIFCFKDSTFECLATSYRATAVPSTTAASLDVRPVPPTLRQRLRQRLRRR